MFLYARPLCNLMLRKPALGNGGGLGEKPQNGPLDAYGCRQGHEEQIVGRGVGAGVYTTAPQQTFTSSPPGVGHSGCWINSLEDKEPPPPCPVYLIALSISTWGGVFTSGCWNRKLRLFSGL